MGGPRPKQYLSIQNKPILQHTLERLALPEMAGIVVCLADQDPYWPSLKLALPVPLIVAAGGAERYHSVLNGLRALEGLAQTNDWILVHDAARPCVRQSDIRKLMTQLANHPVGGLLAIPVRDTIKRSAQASCEILETVNREGLWQALTPQLFRFAPLLQALETVVEQQRWVTDEAQAIEYQGGIPWLIEGHADNIKITHSQDLIWAELYLRAQAAESVNVVSSVIAGPSPILPRIKTGLGQDSHRFELQDHHKPLILGGILFPNDPPLQGNSDADVLLHAITNAISGLTGINILGPRSDDLCLNQGITDSRIYLQEALKHLGDWTITHLSCSIEGKRPKITPRLMELKSSLAQLLNLPIENIGITATTGEELTAFGRGEGIQVFCIVTAVSFST